MVDYMARIIYAMERFGQRNDSGPCDGGVSGQESPWSRSFPWAGPEYRDAEPGCFCRLLEMVDGFLTRTGKYFR